MTPEERRKRLEERMAAMSPDERKAFEERMAARGQGGQGGRGGQPGGGGRGGEGSGRGGPGGGQPDGARQNAAAQPRGAGQGRVASTPSITSGATTIDSLFGPLPVVESRGSAWLMEDKKLKQVRLRLGISDGTNTEILDGAGLKEGSEVVLGITLPDQLTATPGGANANNPLMGPQRGRQGGPGGGGGGGGRGGRG